MNIKKILFIALSGVLLLSGCGDKDTEDDEYLKVAYTGDISTLDPAIIGFTSELEVVNCCQVGLFKADEDGTPTLAGASDYEVSEDGLTYTFHLRDMCWSNGDRVTAGDYVFGMRRAIVSESAVAEYFAEPGFIKGAKEILYEGADTDTLGVYAVDDDTLVIELEYPVAFLPSLLMVPSFYPVNEKFYNSLEEGLFATSPETYLSNGPFVVADYMPGTASIRLEKNENYYDADNISLQGIKIQTVSSSDVALSTYKIDQFDIIAISADQANKLSGDPVYSKEINEVAVGDLSFLTFNISSDVQNGALQNLNFRKAVSCAIDRTYLAKNVYNGAAGELYGLVPDGFSSSLTTGEDFAVSSDKYKDEIADMSLASEYFELAKKELGKDKITLKLTTYSSLSNVVQAIKSMLEENLDGLTVNIEIVPSSDIFSTLKNGDFEMAFMNWVGDYADPSAYLSIFQNNGVCNYGGWYNAQYNDLLKECSTGKYATDYDKRWEAMHEAEEILLEDMPLTPIVSSEKNYLIKSGISGFEYNPSTSAYFGNISFN